MAAPAAVQLEGGLACVLREALLNDSLTDMALATATYQAVLSLVKRCAASQLLVPVLTRPADWPPALEAAPAAASAAAPAPARRTRGGAAAAGGSAASASASVPTDSPSVADQLAQLRQMCDSYARLSGNFGAVDDSDVGVVALVLEITDAAATADEALASCSLAHQARPPSPRLSRGAPLSLLCVRRVTQRDPATRQCRRGPRRLLAALRARKPRERDWRPSCASCGW